MTEIGKDPQTDGAQGDADIGRLLRAAGRRIEPPEALGREVRNATQNEWRAFLQERQHRRRRRTMRFAAAAALALVAISLWLGRTVWMTSPPETLATVRRTFGDVRLGGGLVFPSDRALLAGQALRLGDRVITGPVAATAAIELEDGSTVRLDADTRIAFDGQHLVLKTGAVYVDARGSAAQLLIDTPLGTVRHLSTQYEVRLIGNDLQVSVREGHVETTVETGETHIAGAGERLTIAPTGQVERQAIMSYGPQWDWIARAALPFVIDRLPLTEFLAAVGREVGREIAFTTPSAEAEARTVILRGGPIDLPPQSALAAVMSTTRLSSIERGGQILIELNAR